MAPGKAELALLAVALGFAVLLAESALRLAGISHPLFFEADEVTGSRHIPGSEGLYTREGRGYIRINSDGWRDREHAKSASPEVSRIAVLGDSYTSAFEVESAERFSSVVEERLNAAGANPVEVLNLGIQGYGTAQELLLLQQRVLDYAPDLVLLAFFSGNDVSDNSRELLGLDRIPYFVRKSDKLELDDRFLTAESFRKRQGWLSRTFLKVAPHSRILQVANNLRFTRWRRSRTAHLPWGGVEGATEAGLLNAIYVDPPDGAWQEAWRTTEELLGLLQAECLQHGAEFRVVVLSNPIQVHPDLALRRRLADSLGTDDLYYPDRRLAAAGERSGFPVLVLAPELASHAAAEHEYLHGFGETLGTGHWNARGHQLAGERIASWLATTARR